MPAYMREIPIDECYDGSCIQRATVRVFNTLNADLGPYCRRHGVAYVQKLNAERQPMIERDPFNDLDSLRKS